MAFIIPALTQGYFSMWIRVRLSLQKGRQSLSFFLHRCRFALWGSVSTAAFICSAGRDCTAFNHRQAPSGLAVLIICPCFSRLFSSVSLLTSSACWVARLAADTNNFLFRFGSYAMQGIPDDHRCFELLPRECEIVL